MTLAYVDQLIAAYEAGQATDHMHLGWFDKGCDRRDLAAAQDRMVQRHIERLDLAGGQVIVDVGCGLGGPLRVIDAQVRAVRLIGVNIDPRQIAVAKRLHLQAPVEWRLADAARFSVGAEAWADRVLSLEAMFHFPDPQGFLITAAQALRVGGRMVVSTLVLAPDGPDQVAAAQVVCDGYAPWPHPGMTIPDLAAMVAKARLETVEMIDISGPVRPTLALIAPRPPLEITADPVTEFRRLAEAGALRYVLAVLRR